MVGIFGVILRGFLPLYPSEECTPPSAPLFEGGGGGDLRHSEATLMMTGGRCVLLLTGLESRIRNKP
jgi:hypothetical protein